MASVPNSIHGFKNQLSMRYFLVVATEVKKEKCRPQRGVVSLLRLPLLYAVRGVVNSLRNRSRQQMVGALSRPLSRDYRGHRSGIAGAAGLVSGVGLGLVLGWRSGRGSVGRSGESEIPQPVFGHRQGNVDMDLVDLLHGFFVQNQIGGSEVRLELIKLADADNGRGDEIMLFAPSDG